jgi:hypothetical protein
MIKYHSDPYFNPTGLKAGDLIKYQQQHCIVMDISYGRMIIHVVELGSIEVFNISYVKNHPQYFKKVSI